MNLKELLAERNIVCAHLVDDAFDSRPTVPLSNQIVQEFFENAGNEVLANVCNIFELASDDEDGVRARLGQLDTVQALYARKDELTEPARRLLFGPFEQEKLGLQRPLLPLIGLLEANDVKCLKFGSDYDPRHEDAPQILFIDLKLKEGDPTEVRHEDAVAICATAQRAYEACRPFIFLMSSLPTKLREKREDFRRDAELFQSEFEAVAKSDFENADDFGRALANYTNSMAKIRELSVSMEKVGKAFSVAGKNVLEGLRELDLADYFVLHHNTTSIDKVQLGPYVVEMMLEVLAHEVEGQQELWELSMVLDSLKMPDLPRARFGLTAAAAKLYSANMIHSGAMLLAEDTMQQGPAHGYFYTGDIYLDAQAMNLPAPKRAFIIITPACDLVRPAQMKGKSVLLCEGAVEVINPSSKLIAADALPLTVMPHPRDSNQFIGITWNKKKISVWHDDDRSKFSDAENCSFIRHGRLRPVYALQIQHAVTADLSRVGTQKPPSSLVPHGLSCYISDGKNWHQFFSDDSVDSAAFSEADVDADKTNVIYIVSDAALNAAMARIKSWIEENPDLPLKDKLIRIVENGQRDILRGFSEEVSRRAPDTTAFPYQGKWDAQDGKLVALARGKKSTYAQVKDKQRFNNNCAARIVFVLEDPPAPPAVEATLAAAVAAAPP